MALEIFLESCHPTVWPYCGNILIDNPDIIPVQAALRALIQQAHAGLLHRALSKILLLLLFLLLMENYEGRIRLIIESKETAYGLAGYQTVCNVIPGI